MYWKGIIRVVGMLTKEIREKIARELYEAEKSRVPISKISRQYPEMDVVDSYEIQQIGLELRLKEGRKIIGRKIGITSKGMQQQLQVDTPDYGYLLDSMLLDEGRPCEMKELVSPRLEGELAFILGEDISGPGVTYGDICNCTAWVVPCFEVCDTRIANWDVTVRDTISDNAGACRLVLGSAPKRLSEINPRLIGMAVEKNGILEGSAAGVEVMGNPVSSVAWLVNKLSEFGTGLKAGDIILSGAFMSAIPAKAGDIFTLNVDGFPGLNLRFQ